MTQHKLHTDLDGIKTLLQALMKSHSEEIKRTIEKHWNGDFRVTTHYSMENALEGAIQSIEEALGIYEAVNGLDAEPLTKADIRGMEAEYHADLAREGY